MPNTYAPGIHGVAIADQSAAGVPIDTIIDPTTIGNYTFLAQKESHDYTLDIEKNVRNYQRFSAFEAQAVVVGGRLAQHTIRGDVDTVIYPMLVKANVGTAVSTVYTLGGLLGSARNKLSILVTNGKTDGVTGTSMGIIFDKLRSCRVTELHAFVDDTDKIWKYEATIVGIYAGTVSVTASTIDQSASAAAILYPLGNTVVTYGAFSPSLLTLGIHMVNAGDPLYGTVTASQGNTNGATDPNGFDNGALGSTIDALIRSSEANGTFYDDFQANTERAWTVVCNPVSGSHVITYTMPRVQILTGPPTPEVSQRITLSAVVLAGMTVTIA
jgi:hypothetical protein